MTVTRNVFSSPSNKSPDELFALGEAFTVTCFGAEFLLIPCDGGFKIYHRGSRQHLKTVQGLQADAVQWIKDHF